MKARDLLIKNKNNQISQGHNFDRFHMPSKSYLFPFLKRLLLKNLSHTQHWLKRKKKAEIGIECETRAPSQTPRDTEEARRHTLSQTLIVPDVTYFLSINYRLAMPNRYVSSVYLHKGQIAI